MMTRIFAFCLALAGMISHAQNTCVATDDGSGTVNLPPADCDYLSPGDFHMIVDGLEPGTTILIDPIHRRFVCDGTGDAEHCGEAGGNLGGEREQFSSEIVLQMTGTGELAGFTHQVLMPLFVETHTGPRNLGDPVQSFPTEMFQLVGSIMGDPVFQELTIVGGTFYTGSTNPGSTTLTQLPNGDFNVDSFFDVTYQIDFVGAPGSVLDGMSGSTAGTIRMDTGDPPDPPEPEPCAVADDGTGTVSLPPEDCPYLAPDEVHMIIDGLDPGTEIILEPVHTAFFCNDPGSTRCGQPGGDLGGEMESFDSVIQFSMRGTGDLEGYERTIALELACLSLTGPRNPGDPIQDFPTEMLSMQGQLFGDPDFQSFEVLAGRANDLPASSGHTTMIDQGDGTFLVDSFFDIVYLVSFTGQPGGRFDSLSGTTQGLARMRAGQSFDPLPPGPCLQGRPDLPVPPPVILPPPDCAYISEDPLEITPGPSTRGISGGALEVTVVHQDFDCGNDPSLCGQPGGALGGEHEIFDSVLLLHITGTGAFSSYSRTLVVPTSVETDTGPRDPADPVQEFANAMFRLQGEITGDPDFDLFRVTGGNDFDLDSNGRTVVTDLGDGNVNIDSFFDITYEIEYVASETGALNGISGLAVGKHRVRAGERRIVPAPCCTQGADGVPLLPPPDCEYLSPEDVHMIIDGLPPGTTIELDASHQQFVCTDPQPNGLCGQVGGELGGRVETFDSTGILWVTGTGELLCLVRDLAVPLLVETHTGPIDPQLSVQVIPNQIASLIGSLPAGDPDFEQLLLTGGTDNGLASSGRTQLTRLPTGEFAVDSFFDITYRIDFQGEVGSRLEGLASTSTGSIRVSTGDRKPYLKLAPHFGDPAARITVFVASVNAVVTLEDP